MSACVPIVAASINRSIAVSSAPHAMTVLNSCAIRSAASFNVTKVRAACSSLGTAFERLDLFKPRPIEPPRPAFRERIEGVLFAGGGNAVPREVIIGSVHAGERPRPRFVAVCAAREHTDGQFAGSDGDAPFHALH